MERIEGFDSVEGFITDVESKVNELEGIMPNPETFGYPYLIVKVYDDTDFFKEKIIELHYEKKLYRTGFKWEPYEYFFFLIKKSYI